MSRPGGIATQVAAELWHDRGWPRQRARKRPWLARDSSAVRRHAQFGTRCPHERADLEDCEGCGRSNLTTLGTCPAVCRLSPDGRESHSPCQILNLCTCARPKQMPLRRGRGIHIGRRECRFHTKALGPPLGLEGGKGLAGMLSMPFAGRPA